jgi:hypothetical protein
MAVVDQDMKQELLISLTREDGKEVWLNVALVRMVEPSTQGKSLVSFAPDHYVIVLGEPHEVVRTLSYGD